VAVAGAAVQLGRNLEYMMGRWGIASKVVAGLSGSGYMASVPAVEVAAASMLVDWVGDWCVQEDLKEADSALAVDLTTLPHILGRGMADAVAAALGSEGLGESLVKDKFEAAHFGKEIVVDEAFVAGVHLMAARIGLGLIYFVEGVENERLRSETVPGFELGDQSSKPLRDPMATEAVVARTW
jgi:hypothetical protein